MKRQQWITTAIGFVLVILIYLFGRTVPLKTPDRAISKNSEGTGILSTDTLLTHAKEQLSPEQINRLTALENSLPGGQAGISRGNVTSQQLQVYHQLAHFWKDSVRLFEPYAWYEAEAARLENSEKSLTFAAHLILNNLEVERNPELKLWKARQAKDLFERSLKINPGNDSSIVGLGACYIYGNISDTPMEGILKVRKVIEKDSTNVFAQMTLAHASMISGQYDKALARFQQVIRLHPENLEAILSLAEVFELKGDKESAISWYKKSLSLINIPALKAEVEDRLANLKK